MRSLRRRETTADWPHRDATGQQRPHREPSVAPIVVTTIALCLAFVMMTLIWQAAT